MEGVLTHWDKSHITEILADKAIMGLFCKEDSLPSAKVEIDKNGDIELFFDGKGWSWLAKLTKDCTRVSFEKFAFTVINYLSGTGRNRNTRYFNDFTLDIVRKAFQEKNLHACADALFDAYRYSSPNGRSSFVNVDNSSGKTRRLLDDGRVVLNSGEPFGAPFRIEIIRQ